MTALEFDKNQPIKRTGGPAPRSGSYRPRTVCVVDTDTGFSEMSTRLAGLGYTIIDGRNGLPDGEFWAVIISSAVDPELELAQECAKKHHTILVAEEPTFELRLAAARAGVEAVIWPPIEMVELGAWLGDFHDREEPVYEILIIDDDELAGHAHALALEQAGLRAHVITDPTKAIDTLDELNPDLVLLDMHMPGVNGIEIAKIIRQEHHHLTLPILFLSSERDEMRQQEARQVGGDDFIAKPVDGQTLARLVKIRANRARKLKQVAERDGLTGLLDHVRFKERLNAEIIRSQRSGTPLSLCLIDIDHFKKVNDTHGHQAGDRVIQTLAHSLTGALRRSDVIGRYGGEEFAVILLDTELDAAATVINRIREAFSWLDFHAGETTFSCTMSAGIAAAHKSDTTEAIIGRADEALYSAKNQGRDRVECEQEPKRPSVLNRGTRHAS